MRITDKIKVLLIGLLLAQGGTVLCQTNGNALVDKRVTLDKDNNIVDQGRPQQQQPASAQGHTDRRPAAQAQQDTTPQFSFPSSGGNMTVSAQVDTATMVVGEQKTLSITVRRIDKNKPLDPVGLPTLQELTKGAVEALESETDTIYAENGEIDGITQNVTVTSFDQGHHRIDHIVVKAFVGGELTPLSPAEELWLNVAYSADADTVKCELKADAPHLKEPYTFWEVIRWILLVILCVGAILLTIWVIKRRKEHKPIVVLPKAKPIPADRKALSELESLRRKELWQKGRIKKYYTDLTDVVRRFLRNMYGINATEMTTRQTLRAFRNIEDWSEESNELLLQLLNKADMVKFAKSQPESHEHDLSMQNAMDFVRKVAETHRLNNPEKEGDK